MKVLVLGSGGREHSILLKLKNDNTTELYCLPGNAGTSEIAENISIDISDHEKIIETVKEKGIDLTIAGPEQPLIEGIADKFIKEGLKIFGPSAKASEIEGSKAFSKELMKKYNIPTASYEVFTDAAEAYRYLKSSAHPLVVKASGLAAGKGAVVCENIEQSRKAVREMMEDRVFGKAGDEIVIEEFLSGQEASVFAITDGKYHKILAPAQDHKAVYDGDKGQNTGGMGSYSPAPVIDSAMLESIEKEIIEPTLNAMRKEGREYKGVLFAGLMITCSGPKVIEFNCRFGDPETQVILPVLKGDLLSLMYDAAGKGFTSNEILPVKDSHCLCLVLSSGGYPKSYTKGYEIKGLEKVKDDAHTVHAGTKIENGRTVTSGGRVLGVVAEGKTLQEAKKKAYENAGKIEFKDKYYRTDIGDKGIRFYKEI